MLLTGSYRRALDDKQRLAIPKPLREQHLAGEPLYLTPGLDGCLSVYPKGPFAAVAHRLSANSPGSREVRDYSRLFYSQAACVVPDSQWRFRVTPELAAWAELNGEVVVVGVRDHLEVWSAEKWDQYLARCDGHYEQLAEIALVGQAPAHESASADHAAVNGHQKVETAAPMMANRLPR
jgi:MraZ protein